MALTMVHLLVADMWAKGHPEYLDSPEYYYGAVAPDAIHVRDGNDKSHKNEIHLNNWGTLHRQDVVDYWRLRRAPFDIGYGVHVLTDAQWVPRYKRRLPGMMPGGKLDIPRYYNDTFVTDFALLHGNPRLGEVLDMLQSAEIPSDHPLLTAHEFTAWREIILKAYRGECPRHDPVRFVTVPYALEFARDSIALIDEVYAEAFGES